MNNTIDDSLGDSQTGLTVTYLPADGAWNDQTCSRCSIYNPIASSAFEGTFTAGTYRPSLGSMNITMKFNGTAIYVYFILINTDDLGDRGPSTLANFTVDENIPVLFTHIPDVTADAVLYNQLVFTRVNLPNTQHTVLISTSGDEVGVYVNFDYAIYTQDDAAIDSQLNITESPMQLTSSTTVTFSTLPSTTILNPTTASMPTAIIATDIALHLKSKMSTKAVAGIIVGILASFLIMVFIFYLWRQRQCLKETIAVPYVGPAGTSAYTAHDVIPPKKYENLPADFTGLPQNGAEAMRIVRHNELDQRIRNVQAEIRHIINLLEEQHFSADMQRRTSGDPLPEYSGGRQ